MSHCTRLSDADFDAIAASSTAVALTPASDMAGGVGPPPMQQLIDRGIRPGLGVGDERLAPGDVFAQMRAVISVQHATLFDLKLAGKGGIPNLLGTRDVIRYATIDGARVAGLADITGSLSPGKRADVIVLRADRPNIAPVNDPIGAVVWGMDTSNIDWVFVGGASLVENGELTADVASARALADGGPASGRSSGRPRRRRSGSAMTARTVPSAALTRFVVASRYMPVYLALILLVVVAAIWVPETLSPVALSAIAPFGALLAITALGQMLVIMTGGIDLSTPGTLTLAAMIMAGVGEQSDSRIWIAILAAVGAAAVIGLVNGILIGGLKLNALIVTLATGQIVVGVVSRYVSTFPVQSAVPLGLSDWAATRILGVSPIFWMGVAVTLLLIVGLRYTSVGRRFQVVGANPVSSHVMGVRVTLTQTLVYVVAAVLYAIAGVALAGLLRNPGVNIGSPYLLGPIAAVVIGGASLAGGLASPLSTFAAAFFLTGLNQMMRSLGLATSLQFLVFGLVIIGGMLISGDRIIKGVEALFRERRISVETK